MRLIHGDCMEAMRRLIDEGVTVHSIVTDPPYGLTSVVKRFGKDGSAPAKSEGPTGVYKRASAGFMGQTWDGSGIEYNVEMWRLCYDLLPPGGHLLAFGGTRTWHRIASAIEDAGFEIRDTVAWLYGVGFPKSHDVSKGIDREAGAERAVIGSKLGLPGYHLHGHDGGEAFGAGLSSSTYETRLKSSQITAPATPEAAAWNGWGTALKPAFEPIIVARKPLAGTVAQNVLAHGTGAINIDGCRVGQEVTVTRRNGDSGKQTFGRDTRVFVRENPPGRWPANVVHDGSDEVEAAFAAFGERPGQIAKASSSETRKNQNVYGEMARGSGHAEPRNDSGTASRFFYCSKASKADRGEGNVHPTVKPTDLKRWLCRLVTPPGGTVLDPFMGSGSTGKAAALEGFSFIGIEQSVDYLRIAQARIPGSTAQGHQDSLITLLARAARARAYATEVLRGL